MGLHLFDTMSRQVRDVKTVEPGHVRIYTCGPTVYAFSHIGNFRTFVFEDVLRRWLDRRFDRVTHVMNLTDVDDKIICNATANGHSLDEEVKPWIDAFFNDRDILGIRPAHHYPRATEYIAQMLDIIGRLDERGLTYRADSSVYFRVGAFPKYGRLSGLHTEGLAAGASGRVDADEYDKDDVRDFALWKSVAPGEIGWDTPLGRGRPGWHIECSAMSMSLLGENIDIHCGGVDNIFPHHENEIAQSEGATGSTFVRLWCHAAHLRIGGEKMAKSLGNFSTVHDIVQSGQARPSALRYLLAAGAHYRKSLNYSDDALHMATEAVDRWVAFRDRVAEHHPAVIAPPDAKRVLERADAAFQRAMDDDLNLPEALGAVFQAVRTLNQLLDGNLVSDSVLGDIRSFIRDVDDVLGVLPLVDKERETPLDVEDARLLDERIAARASCDWAASDQLRNQLAKRGIVVDDTPQGQRWHRG